MNRINAVGPAERNKQPIFTALAPVVPHGARVLEIGAGNGTHARHAIACLDAVEWQTTEHPDRMTELRTALADHPTLPAPKPLAVRTGDWPVGPHDLVYAANVAHIMHWPDVVAMMAGAAAVISGHGLLCLYGPFFDDERATADSNIAFDRYLRKEDPDKGLRRIQALHASAGKHGLVPFRDWLMPANNRLLLWRRRI